MGDRGNRPAWVRRIPAAVISLAGFGLLGLAAGFKWGGLTAPDQTWATAIGVGCALIAVLVYRGLPR